MAIADQLSRLNELRQNLADTLTTKGVTAASTEGLETLVPKVAEIEGKTQVQQYAGTFTTDSSGKATIDCGFSPDIVTLQFGELVTSLSSAEISASVNFAASLSSFETKNTCSWPPDNNGVFDIEFTKSDAGFNVRISRYDSNWNISRLANSTINFVAVKYI